MKEPRNAIDAVTHADPYPWYARMATERPLVFDESLQLWVAFAPSVVDEALANPALHVRPPGEAVPAALRGTAAGEVFARLVRMNDGDFHAQHRPGVERAAARWTLDDVATAARDAAADLMVRQPLDRVLTAVPVQAMARLLGVPALERDVTVHAVHAFVQAIAPGASAVVIAEAEAAVQRLMSQGEAEGLDRVQAANRIALMQQSLDATAGLLGNTLLALRTAELPVTPQAMRAFVERVSLRDPAVHNTRRFAAQDLTLAGQRIARGQGVLLVLAAAQRPFGGGRHGCPGERIAIEIVAAGAAWMRAAALFDPEIAAWGGLYRPLANARIPRFA
jgi:cytochrome P450